MNTTSSYDLICRDVQRSIAVDPHNAICTLLYGAIAAKLKVPHVSDHAKRIKMLLQTSGEVHLKGSVTAQVMCPDLIKVLESNYDKAFDLLCYGISLLEMNDDQKATVIAYGLIMDERVDVIFSSTPGEMLETVKEKL